VRFRFAVAFISLPLAATVVTAQNLDAIRQQRAAMNAIGTACLSNFKMMRGELPFDLDKLQANLKPLQAEGQIFDFPLIVFQTSHPQRGSCVQNISIPVYSRSSTVDHL
jgi:cytochrome c556